MHPQKGMRIYTAELFPLSLCKYPRKMENNHRTARNVRLEMTRIVSVTSQAFLYGSGGESVGNLPADAGQMFITCPGNAGIWTSRSV